MRKWLNGRKKNDFLQAAFTAEEREQIMTTIIAADRIPYWVTNPGKPSKDKVFLLSLSEVREMFSSFETRRCAATDFAKIQGVQTHDSFKTEGNPACYWWLRSLCADPDFVACVDIIGSILESEHFVFDKRVGVRPALWVKL